MNEMIKIEEKKNNNKRILYFDVLNILSIISVIALHMNGIVHNSPQIRAWKTSLIVECICYWAVPVFLMLTGATLMGYRDKYDTKVFFKKRLIKILIPFVFWAFVMFIWKVFIIKWLDKPISFVDWINAFFENREESIYYFLFEIIGIYLTMPFLSRLAKDEYRNTLWLTVLLYFIFNALLPNIFILFKINFNMLVSVRLGGWIIFVILGWLLSTQEVNKKCRVIIYFGAILGLIYRYVITYKLTMKNGIVYKDIWGYTTWHSILLSSAIFIFIKYLNFEKKFENKEKTKKCISQISSCSFGIYLIHMFLKYYEIELFHLNEFSWKYRTIGIVITYFLSLIVVYIIKKIPIIKYVVP